MRHFRAGMPTMLQIVLSSIIAMACSWSNFSAQAAEPQREWTVLVYINGKNNLEADALLNFHQMASVGSSKDVNIVVQLGRPSKKKYTSGDGNWSGVHRFLITTGMNPLPASAVMDVQKSRRPTDMGRPDALQDFVKWAVKEYPAKRYFLIIWNHGQGWRFQLAGDPAVKTAASKSLTPAMAIFEPGKASAPPPTLGGYRAVSSDDDTGSILYNKEVQEVVANAFPNKGLHLLGFDACLMAMIETAYALTTSTRALVASEELEPGAGWNYKRWLTPLVADPTMDEEKLARLIVDTYRDEYGDAYETTLSGVRLANIRELSGRLSRFADKVRAAGEPEFANFRKARDGLVSYGASAVPPLKTSVDLLALLQRYSEATANSELKSEAQAIVAQFGAEIIRNYASERSAKPPSRDPAGSMGIAIYFPETRQDFDDDPYRVGYLKGNKDRPVDFVVNERWAELIYAILGVKG